MSLKSKFQEEERTIQIERDSFLNALAKTKSVVEKRSSMPILEHVRISVQGDTLSVTSTDMDITIVDSITIDTHHDFEFTTVAHILYEIVRRIYDSSTLKLVLNQTKNTLTITAGRSQFLLPTLDASDFPSFDCNINQFQFEIGASLLKFLLVHTRHAMSLADIRYYLNGIYLHTVDTGSDRILRMVATDTHRLAGAEVLLKDAKLPSDFGLILPRKTVNELAKLLEDVEEDLAISIAADNNRILFKIGRVMIVSKVIDAKFPDYTRSYMITNDKKFVVNVQNMKRAIDLVSVVSEGKSRELVLTIDKNRIVVSVTNNVSIIGYAKQEIEVEFSCDEQLEIMVNSRYLLECLNGIDGTRAEFLISDSLSPLVVQDCDDNRCKDILMPMRLQR